MLMLTMMLRVRSWHKKCRVASWSWEVQVGSWTTWRRKGWSETCETKQVAVKGKIGEERVWSYTVFSWKLWSKKWRNLEFVM